MFRDATAAGNRFALAWLQGARKRKKVKAAGQGLCSTAVAGWANRQISMPYAEYFLHMKTTGCGLGAGSEIRLG